MKTKLSSIITFVFFLLIASASVAYAQGESATSTPSQSVTFHIRYQDELVFEGSWDLGEPETILIEDNTGVKRMATSTSVLALLLEIDEAEDSFRVADLAYFESFGAFLINCIEIPARSVNACFNWQYVVNGVFPFVGTNDFLLTDGDNVFFFFGTQHRVVLDKDTVVVEEPFTATAQDYQYQTNEWLPLPDITIGVTQPNPANPFSPLVVASSTASLTGEATFTLSLPGEYNVGIAEDFYFPSVSLTVASSTPSGPSEEEETNGGSGGGGGGSGGGVPTPTHNSLDVDNAIQFLIQHQNSDGSFGNAALYTDWVAIALGAYEKDNPAREALMDYFLIDPNPGTLVTDYERRAMALMALGINPHEGTSTDYIQKILDEFDGNQFGDPNLVNDDIFALFPLVNAGFTQDDEEIAKTISFILSHQQSDGSWIGVDISAAAIQTLSLVSSFDGVSLAINNARQYLKAKQENNGSFGDNVFSTSWVMQAIAALGEKETDWEKNGKTPGDYLFENQSSDGSIGMGDITTRLWATAYAIPASLAKTWDEILDNFSKPVALAGVSGGGGGGGGFSFPQSTSATTTEEFIAQELEEEVMTTAPLAPSEEESFVAQLLEIVPIPITRAVEINSFSPLETQRVDEEEQEASNQELEIVSIKEPLLAYTGISLIREIAKMIFPIGVIISFVLGFYLMRQFFKPS